MNKKKTTAKKKTKRKGDSKQNKIDWGLGKRWYVFGGINPQQLLVRDITTRQLFYPTIQNVADYFGTSLTVTLRRASKDKWTESRQKWLTELEKTIKDEAMNLVVDDIKEILTIGKSIMQKYQTDLGTRTNVEFKEVAHFSNMIVRIYQAGMSGKDTILNIAENYAPIIAGIRDVPEEEYMQSGDDK